jgi:putative Mn2+ efflux pump MntP
MDFPLLDFMLASLIMGLGIGADVAVATMIRAKHLTTIRAILFWVIGVSFTHTVFPMAGYLLTYFSVEHLPVLTPIVGVVAFAFIARFLYLELGDYVGEEGESSALNQTDERQLMMSMGLILAVSWDALWSGPAKSAQVIGWPELFVWGSFMFVGGVVALCALGGLGISKYVSLSKVSKQTQSLWQYTGVLIQYSVIAYFGILALLRYTLHLNIHWWQVLFICLVTVLVTLESLQVRTKLQEI